MMGFSDTPAAERVHIGFFGRRNAGKSSLVNAITGQELSVVSDVKGTTTDPVYKAMELLPIGPVMILDTPGFDDEGTLGALRVQKTKQVLGKTDIAVLVVDVIEGFGAPEEELLSLIQARGIPYLIVYNKSELSDTGRSVAENEIFVSAKQRTHIQELKERIGAMMKTGEKRRFLVRDLLKPNDFVLLVTPIDASAPKGRLILPQQQVIRDIIDGDSTANVVREAQLKTTLARLAEPPAMVITDSQVFSFVDRETPKDIPLTSFSILMARYKGFLQMSVRGVSAMKTLKNGDIVLIAEGCTHHRQCEDIGTVKIPRWLRETTGKKIKIETASGREFPEDLSKYALVIHCGGCMLNAREMQTRMQRVVAQGIPVTNYGVLIAYMKGILKRSLSVFEDITELSEIETG